MILDNAFQDPRRVEELRKFVRANGYVRGVDVIAALMIYHEERDHDPVLRKRQVQEGLWALQEELRVQHNKLVDGSLPELPSGSQDRSYGSAELMS